jgi:hypothetical protein
MDEERPLPDALRKEIEETAAFWRSTAPRHASRGARLTTPWTIYLFQEGDDGPVKVGKTKSLPDRLNTARTFNARPVHLRAYFTGTEKDERMLHALFAAHHIRGEWFHPAEPVLDFIRKVEPLRGKPLQSSGSR